MKLTVLQNVLEMSLCGWVGVCVCFVFFGGGGHVCAE